VVEATGVLRFSLVGKLVDIVASIAEEVKQKNK